MENQSNSEAALPGQTAIQIDKFKRYYKFNSLNIFFLKLCLLLPEATFTNLSSYFNVLFKYRRIKHQFANGCVNPAMIVDADNGLVATFTNLTKQGENQYPVIKITKEKTGLIKNEKVKNGTLFSSIAVYEGFDNDEAWIDFHPIVTNCLTDDMDVCNKNKTILNNLAWDCLQLGLKQIEKPYQIGLYQVNLNDEMVQQAY